MRLQKIIISVYKLTDTMLICFAKSGIRFKIFHTHDMLWTTFTLSYGKKRKQLLSVDPSLNWFWDVSQSNWYNGLVQYSDRPLLWMSKAGWQTLVKCSSVMLRWLESELGWVGAQILQPSWAFKAATEARPLGLHDLKLCDVPELEITHPL